MNASRVISREVASPIRNLGAKLTRMGKEDELVEQIISDYFSRIGRKGAKVRNERLTAEERREIAIRAAIAATAVRKEKASQREKGHKAAQAPRWAKRKG